MTHALHRRLADKTGDYVLMMRSSKGINRAGAGAKLLKFIDRVEPLGPVNFGNPADGTLLRTERDAIRKHIDDESNLHIVFKDGESVRRAVEIAKEMDAGLSVSLTGPLDGIRTLASELDLKIDSIQIDLGTIGRTPFDAATEGIISMCGHMRISPNLFRELRQKVQTGEMQAEAAAREIGRACLCGCFNTDAAAKILSGAES